MVFTWVVPCWALLAVHMPCTVVDLKYIRISCKYLQYGDKLLSPNDTYHWQLLRKTGGLKVQQVRQFTQQDLIIKHILSTSTTRIVRKPLRRICTLILVRTVANMAILIQWELGRYKNNITISNTLNGHLDIFFHKQALSGVDDVCKIQKGK